MPFIIDDDNYRQVIKVQVVNGEKKAKGLIPRDYLTHPYCWSKLCRSLDMPLISRNEYAERIREKEANKSGLQYIRRTCGPNGGRMPSLDQNGQGYCWMYSGTAGVMLCRGLMGEPYVRLSAHAGACMIKNFRDQGGWGAAGLDWLIEKGQPSVEFWPEKSMSRSNDKPEVWENAKKHRVSEYWMDLAPPAYNRNLSEDQACTALLTDCPVIGDFNWWGHSVILMAVTISSQAKKKSSMLKTDFDSLDLDDKKDRAIYEAAFGKLGLNSWTDSWGDKGEFTLEGSKAILNGGSAIRATRPSIN